MTEVEALLHSAAAVLLLCLAFHHPRLAGRIGRWGFALMLAGSLIPLLDFAIFYFSAHDRIDFLTQPPVFYGVFNGLVLIGIVSGLTAFLVNARAAVSVAAVLCAGYFLHLLLALLTPEGVPLLSPFSAWRPRLPFFTGGHPLLVALLVLVLVLVESFQRYSRITLRAGVLLLVLYILAGTGQFAYIALQARTLAAPGSSVYVEPSNAWLTRWLVTVADGEVYQVRRHGVNMPGFEQPEILPRWNDESLMIQLLADPTVNHFYYQVFRHPVVRTEADGAQYTLIMQELADQFPLVPGRTLYYESDAEGRNRFYQLQRFD